MMPDQTVALDDLMVGRHRQCLVCSRATSSGYEGVWIFTEVPLAVAYVACPSCAKRSDSQEVLDRRLRTCYGLPQKP